MEYDKFSGGSADETPIMWYAVIQSEIFGSSNKLLADSSNQIVGMVLKFARFDYFA